MKKLMQLTIEDICRDCEVSPEIVELFISEEWVIPSDQNAKIFDEEDLARISLIMELREELGVNDEALPIILNLLDQLHLLRNRIRQLHRE